MFIEQSEKRDFKRVPALDKCFRMLDLLAESEKPLCISEIARHLNYNKSTVYGLVHTLRDLEVLEKVNRNRFHFGTRLYALGKCSGIGSDLISVVHPHLEEISRETGLSSFLGIRSGDSAVILDKVDSPSELRVSSEVGKKIPLHASSAGKALLSQLGDSELDEFLSETKLNKFTSASCVEPLRFREMIRRARREGFAMDDEEYMAGIRAVAVPLRLNRDTLCAAIWVVGLKSQIRDQDLPSCMSALMQAARRVETRLIFGRSDRQPRHVDGNAPQ